MTTATDDRVKELAVKAANHLVTKTRDDKSEYISLKAGAPQWMKDLCRAAHDNARILPDDFRYDFIASALCLISEADDLDDISVMESVDVYTADLTRWLHSKVDRYGYCDEYLEMIGTLPTSQGNPTIALLSGGQQMEREEVLRQVLEFLTERAKSE